MVASGTKTKVSPDKVDLHDALLRALHVDYALSRCVIEIDYYLSGEASKRVPGRIVFDAMETIAFIGDIVALKRQEFAGHIVDWRPAADLGETHIYLAAGSIVVRAKKIALERERKTARGGKQGAA